VIEQLKDGRFNEMEGGKMMSGGEINRVQRLL
jgi:hypothetical protein